jgi:hypothetical protein
MKNASEMKNEGMKLKDAAMGMSLPGWIPFDPCPRVYDALALLFRTSQITAAFLALFHYYRESPT